MKRKVYTSTPMETGQESHLFPFVQQVQIELQTTNRCGSNLAGIKSLQPHWPFVDIAEESLSKNLH